MGEGVVDRGDEHTFETRSPGGFRTVLCVLSNLRDVPCVEVVLNLEPALMMEAVASCLSRRVDAPLRGGCGVGWGGVGGGELSDELVLCDEIDGMFANGSYGEGSDWRCLSFARGGDMNRRMLVHPWVEDSREVEGFRA